MAKFLVEPAGLSEKGECGYCKSHSTSVSFGFSSNSIPAEIYEGLMLKGWRRSGNYFYRAINHLTCCPMYTIRLSSSEFSPSKSQRKVLKHVDRYFETHTLDISFLPASYSEEKYQLYKKYQVQIHGDEEADLTPLGFTRFLITSPLTSDALHIHIGLPFGTYHQEYRCDGKLFAVGVLDLLPSGLSSVYFFYDPEMKSLSLGKFSALTELNFCKNNNLPYYYMGFYIHSCEKMKYKAEYKPSELLCPVTNRWFYLSDVVDKIERCKFAPFDEDIFQRRLEIAEEDSAQLIELYPKPPPADAILQIPILLSSYGREVKLSDLTPKGKTIMIKILKDLLQYMPLDIFLKMTIVV